MMKYLSVLAVLLCVVVCASSAAADDRITSRVLRELDFQIAISCGCEYFVRDIPIGKKQVRLIYEFRRVSLLVAGEEIPLEHIRTAEQLRQLCQALSGEAHGD